MEGRYQHGRTCVFNLNYHIIWCVKYRRKVLTAEVESRLVKLLNQVAGEKGFAVVSAKVGKQDHVHCFVSVPPKLCVSDIARWMKGTTRRHLLMEFPELRRRLWKGHLWNGSYFVESIGSTSEENIPNILKGRRPAGDNA